MCCLAVDRGLVAQLVASLIAEFEPSLAWYFRGYYEMFSTVLLLPLIQEGMLLVKCESMSKLAQEKFG